MTARGLGADWDGATAVRARQAPARRRARPHRALPGFRLTLGFTIAYVSLVVLIPLAGLFVKSAGLGWEGFWETVTAPRVVASYGLTFGTALVAALINTVFGFAVAWVLVRGRFPGRKIVDAAIDLPFALPTAVAGITLATLYSPNGFVGRVLEPLGIKGAFSPFGIVVALTFVGLPFVVRTVQPALMDLDGEVEDAAAVLGASRAQTFRRVIFPAVWPALLTGFTLSFARGLGEYGSIVFISGNMPMKTEVTTLLVVTKLEQYDYAGAAAIAVVMLVLSFSLFLLVNGLQRIAERRRGDA